MSGSDRSMAGKVCLVTGGTSGLGRVTAEALAGRGAEVILVGRDPKRADAAVAEIRAATGNPAVSALVADLSSQAEIRRLAAEFLRDHHRLDVLVNNAGAMFAQRQETVDGIERTFALNHLAYFLLTDLLLGALKAAPAGRIVNVSSMAHQGMRLDFDDLECRRNYRGFRVYGRSKLANLLFNSELARRLEGTGVTANALHPGFVATNFVAGNGMLGWLFRRLASVAAIRPEDGAKTSIYLATSPDVEGLSGRYFAKESEARPSAAARDGEAARRLWEVSEAMTRLKAPAAAAT